MTTFEARSGLKSSYIVPSSSSMRPKILASWVVTHVYLRVLSPSQPCQAQSFTAHSLLDAGDPCPNFWHIGVHKKWYKLSKLGEGAEGWVRGNLDKIQKNSYFFRETFPKVFSACIHSAVTEGLLLIEADGRGGAP